MSKKTKLSKLITVLLVAAMLTVLLSVSALAAGTEVNFNPEKILDGPAGGTGWTFDGTTLVFEEGYIVKISSVTDITCSVINNADVVGGTACSFAGDVTNNGSIDNAAFFGHITNNGTLTYGQFNPAAEVVNNAAGVIDCQSLIMCKVTNYGTMNEPIVVGTINNYGTVSSADCGYASVINNFENATIKDSEIKGELYNAGILENNTIETAFTNEASATITGGTMQEAVKNNGTIAGGTFEAGVNNEADAVISGGNFQTVENYGTITGGTFPAAVNNYSGAVIKGGDFTDTVTNNEGAVIKGGTYTKILVNTGSDTGYHGRVDNMGKIENGDFKCDVLNYGDIAYGHFYGSVGNMETISGGSFYDGVNNDGQILGGNFEGEVVTYSTISGGTFVGNVTVSYGGVIDNGIFMGTVYNEAGVINGGTFSGAVVDGMLDAEDKNWAEVIGQYDKDTVTSADKEKLENAVAAIDELLASDKLSEESKAVLENVKAGANDLLALIDNAQAALNTENIKAAEDITADNAKASDKAVLEKAKSDIESALDTYGKNYTEAESAAANAQLERVNAALDAIAAQDSTDTKVDTPKTGDESNVTLWIAIALLSTLTLAATAGRKETH